MFNIKISGAPGVGKTLATNAIITALTAIGLKAINNDGQNNPPLAGPENVIVNTAIETEGIPADSMKYEVTAPAGADSQFAHFLHTLVGLAVSSTLQEVANYAAKRAEAAAAGATKPGH